MNGKDVEEQLKQPEIQKTLVRVEKPNKRTVNQIMSANSVGDTTKSSARRILDPTQLSSPIE